MFFLTSFRGEVDMKNADALAKNFESYNGLNVTNGGRFFNLFQSFGVEEYR